MQPQAGERSRVTWIEVAIVAVVLAVLAALVVPQFSQAGLDPRERELRSAIQVMRGQIEMYRLQHEDRYPSLAQFTQQLTLSTNTGGQIAPTGTLGYDFGPYLRCVPVNPYCGTNTISSDRNTASAWFYNEHTGEFLPNHLDSH